MTPIVSPPVTFFTFTYTLHFQADDKDPDNQVLSLQGPRRIGLRSKEEYKDVKVLDKYTATISAMFKIIADKEDSDVFATSLASSVVELEKKLSAISMDEEDSYDPLVSPHERLYSECTMLTM